MAGPPVSRRSSPTAMVSCRAPLVVRAPTVVIAAGALRTPAILQATGLEHPHIGRHLRIHPVPVIAGIFSERVEMWRGTLQGARSLEFSEPAAGRNGYVIESAPGHPGLLALGLPWEGTAAHAEVMARMDRLSPLIAVTRDGGEGRASLTKSGGIRLDYSLDPTGVATMRHALVSMARLLRAAGATDIVAVGIAARLVSPGRPRDDRPGSRVRGVRGRAGGIRLRAEPRRRPLRTPDGLGPDGRGRIDASVRPGRPGTRDGSHRPRHRRALRRRRVALPDRDRGQPDDHDHGRRPTCRAR